MSYRHASSFQAEHLGRLPQLMAWMRFPFLIHHIQLACSWSPPFLLFVLPQNNSFQLNLSESNVAKNSRLKYQNLLGQGEANQTSLSHFMGSPPPWPRFLPVLGHKQPSDSRDLRRYLRIQLTKGSLGEGENGWKWSVGKMRRAGCDISRRESIESLWWWWRWYCLMIFCFFFSKRLVSKFKVSPIAAEPAAAHSSPPCLLRPAAKP